MCVISDHFLVIIIDLVDSNGTPFERKEDDAGWASEKLETYRQKWNFKYKLNTKVDIKIETMPDTIVHAAQYKCK